jgi:DNA-binding transcriptional LysR family regulator
MHCSNIDDNYHARPSDEHRAQQDRQTCRRRQAGYSPVAPIGATSVTVEGRIKVASADGVVGCTKAGLGIALATRWMCRAELEAGELVAILSDYQLDGDELHAVYPGGRRPSLKVRAFSDYFAAQLMHKNEGG